MGEAGAESERQGEALLRESCRVTAAAGGVVVLVSLLQEHVLALLLRTFRSGWRLCIQQVPASPDMFTSPLQAFLVVATALDTALPPPPVELRPLPGVAVNAEQARDVAALVERENALRTTSPPGDPYKVLVPGRTLTLPLAGGRFLAAVVDAESVSGGAGGAPRGGPPPTAAAGFLVPQGREHEWLFGSEEGQRKLASSCCAQRLVLICLGRGHIFAGASPAEVQQAVQSELSPLVLPLLPLAVRGAPKGAVPYLTTAEGLGERTLVAEQLSELSGLLMVEDVTFSEEGVETVLRRLVFAANPNLIQSEVRLRPDRTPDHTFLACDYQAALVAGLAVAAPALLAPGPRAAPATPPALCVVGLGGGALPLFLRNHLWLDVSVVELDAEVAKLAASAFAFPASPGAPAERLAVHIADGLRYVEGLPAGSLDALVLDVGSNDASLGMSCPPPAFLAPSFLAAAAAALKPHGCLALNCVARSEASFSGALQALQDVFPVLLQTECDSDDINRLLFARRTPLPVDGGDAAKALREARLAEWHAETDIEALCAGVRLVGGAGGDDLD